MRSFVQDHSQGLCLLDHMGMVLNPPRDTSASHTGQEEDSMEKCAEQGIRWRPRPRKHPVEDSKKTWRETQEPPGLKSGLLAPAGG